MSTDPDHALRKLESLAAISTLNIITLAVLRLALETHDESTLDIRQDILDLRVYPDRLLGSYKQEWQCYCRNRLLRGYKEALRSGIEDSPVKYWNATLQACSDAIESEKDVLGIVEETYRRVTTDKVLNIQSAAQRQIESLIRGS